MRVVTAREVAWHVHVARRVRAAGMVWVALVRKPRDAPRCLALVPPHLDPASVDTFVVAELRSAPMP
jgi:hypothetical protein